VLARDATQFVVVEAKLYSPLSAGTKNAPIFDQAARNLACMAEVLSQAKRQPTAFSKVAFFLVAPRSQLDAAVFGSLLTTESIRAKVKERIAPYLGAKDAWYAECFLPMLAVAQVESIAWESLVQAAGPEYDAFYRKCLKFNRPLPTSTATAEPA
jgi:hypothetical protein